MYHKYWIYSNWIPQCQCVGLQFNLKKSISSVHHIRKTTNATNHNKKQKTHATQHSYHNQHKPNTGHAPCVWLLLDCSVQIMDFGVNWSLFFLIVQECQPERCSSRSKWPGWDGSWRILCAFLRQWSYASPPEKGDGSRWSSVLSPELCMHAVWSNPLI